MNSIQYYIDREQQFDFSSVPSIILNRLQDLKLIPACPSSPQDTFYCLQSLISILGFTPNIISTSLLRFLVSSDKLSSSILLQSFAYRIYYFLLKSNYPLSFTNYNIIYLHGINTNFEFDASASIRLLFSFTIDGKPFIYKYWPASIIPDKSNNIYTAHLDYGSTSGWLLNSDPYPYLYSTTTYYIRKYLDSISLETLKYPFVTNKKIFQSCSVYHSNKPPTSHHFFISNLNSIFEQDHLDFIFELQKDCISNWTTTILPALSL